MSIKLTKSNELIEECYISKPYEIFEYNPMSLFPILEFPVIEFYKDKQPILNFDAIEEELINSNLNVRYLRFSIESQESKIINLLIHNNYRNVKVWKDNVFISQLNDWYEKILINIDPGISTYILEFININTHDNILISIIDNDLPIINDKIIVYNDTRDIKRYFIKTTNNNCDENYNVSFSVRNNYLSNKNDTVLCTIGYNRLNDKYTEFVTLDKISVNVNELVIYNLEKCKNIQEPIIICVSSYGLKEYKPLEKCHYLIFYINKDLSEYNLDTKKKIDKMIIGNIAPWKKDLLELQDGYISGRNCTEAIKYHLKNYYYISESGLDMNPLLQ